MHEGDACTKFFHIQLSHRRKKNRIIRLKTGNGIAVTADEKAEALFHHFQGIMGTEQERTHTIDLEAIGVPTADLQRLDEPFSEEELWATIKTLHKDKGPGPDGFTAEFYQSSWEIIKADLLAAMNAFCRADRRGFRGLNNALITLLPKKVEAEEPGDYRPICLIHSFTKIMAKMMARRLALELDKLVDVNQSASFSKDRSMITSDSCTPRQNCSSKKTWPNYC